MTTVQAPPLNSDAAWKLLETMDADATNHDVDHQGARIRWRQWGQGSPLVLIHGGHGNWMHWIRNIEVLAHQHTVWVPDLPGFGDSGNLTGAPHDPSRQQRLVDALAGSLKQLLGDETLVDMAGFSFGGLVAGQLAAQRQSVRRLALLGTAGHGGERRQVVELVNWRLPDRDAMRAALRHNLASFMLHGFESVDELAMAVHETASRSTRFRSKSASRTAALMEVLESLHQPVLMVWGEHDVTAHPLQAAEQLAQDRPEREWVIVPGAGHWVQYERHQEINQLLGRWFA